MRSASFEFGTDKEPVSGEQKQEQKQEANCSRRKERGAEYGGRFQTQASGVFIFILISSIDWHDHAHSLAHIRLHLFSLQGPSYDRSPDPRWRNSIMGSKGVPMEASYTFSHLYHLSRTDKDHVCM